MLCPDGTQSEKIHAALDLIVEAIQLADLQPGKDVVLALDAAASEFFDEEDGAYKFCYEGDPAETWLSP